MAEPQRLQKLLAQQGLASRRQVEAWIMAGRIRVNGAVVTELGYKADPEQDHIEVDGQRIKFSRDPVRHVLLLHKPVGVLSTCADPWGRKTVLDLLPEPWHSQIRLYPVGRLDADSSGALLLSDDGDLTLKLTHPRYHLPKTYRVQVQGQPSQTTLQHWRDGVDLEGYTTLPAEVERCPAPDFFKRSNPEGSWLRVVLFEGRNRQIRRVAERLGHPVLALHREAIGPLRLGNLKPGQFRQLEPHWIQALLAPFPQR
ncbi:pseudouridine synthase [Thermostichus vulcanus]|uniref:Pseudouridine synthase n=1 Tax=Thermostichus vulcanus str. 'Rupite' TaxID=2813851 RepID=A0ABT0CFA9_THEVL|nr:pseudouridine synthase [Thermostichus vulcanus]MCJ2544407.1 rRNA pseudouridine synthase [Thermostichus vulcanus str. 'Rupite']